MALTENGCRLRRERLWNAVSGEIDWLLITDPRHVNYLSGFCINPLSFSAGERGFLLLERDGGATLLADNFSRRSAVAPPFVDVEAIDPWYDHRHSVTNRDRALFSVLRSRSTRLSDRRGRLEREWFPCAALESVAPGHNLDGSQEAEPGWILRGLRRQKDADEIGLLRTCMRAGEAGQRRAREFVRPGVTELDVFCEIQSAATDAAGSAVMVYGDFRATNAETHKAGGLPTDYRLRDGDLFLLDYSVVINGYRSDLTNTIAVGNATDDQRRISEVCLTALAAGESVLKPGVAAAQVYRAVSQPMQDAGFDPLRHHAGHGIGLSHPEPPILVPESVDELMAGDVVTLEPGMYIEGIGGMRFEHNYLITGTGSERLSNHLLSLDRG